LKVGFAASGRIVTPEGWPLVELHEPGVTVPVVSL